MNAWRGATPFRSRANRHRRIRGALHLGMGTWTNIYETSTLVVVRLTGVLTQIVNDGIHGYRNRSGRRPAIRRSPTVRRDLKFSRRILGRA